MQCREPTQLVKGVRVVSSSTGNAGYDVPSVPGGFCDRGGIVSCPTESLLNL